MNFFYGVKDWEKHFENSESRKVKSLTWLPVKNKHDGKGYRRVVAHPRSVQVFCAWCLMIQVASKMPTRGLLLDEDGPITASDLAFMTGFPEAIFDMAFEVLADPKIGWLERRETGDIRTPPDASGDAGVEQKGTEGNRTEGISPNPMAAGPWAVAEEAREIPTEDQAVEWARTAGSAIDEAFMRYVYRQWAMQNGKNANNVVVPWLAYVTNRWKNESVEWLNGTHRGNRKHAIHAPNGRAVPSRNAGTYNEAHDVNALKKRVR